METHYVENGFVIQRNVQKHCQIYTVSRWYAFHSFIPIVFSGNFQGITEDIYPPKEALNILSILTKHSILDKAQSNLF